MNRITNYKGYSRWWLSAGMVLAILSLEFGGIMMVVAILCFVSYGFQLDSAPSPAWKRWAERRL